VDESINPGESVHVLKVAANDILDNLKEISVENNTKTVALTTQQVNFPDVVADEITWTKISLYPFMLTESGQQNSI